MRFHPMPSTLSSINQSIKIYFLSNRNITVYTVYASAQKAARLIKLAAQTNKRTQNQQEGGKDRGGTNNNMCSASASGYTVINISTLYVQSGLKLSLIHI